MNPKTRNPEHRRACGIACVLIGMLAVSAARGAATNRYVAPQAPASAWPYDSWASAATNIQDAVDAANANNAGDTVFLSNGVYRLTAPVIVSNAVVTSYSGDRAAVVVDGGYPSVTSRCFIVRHADAVLESLTVTNGCAAPDDRQPELLGSGGGIWAEGGLIRDCAIVGCRANLLDANVGGGGIYAENGTVIDGCAVLGNRAVALPDANVQLYIKGGGGGVLLKTDCCMTNCLVSGNTADALTSGTEHISGGGLAILYKATVTHCTIVNNEGERYGGGIYARWGSSGLIQSCTITNNNTVGTTHGGGIAIYGSGSPTVRNCLIADNDGSGLFYMYETPKPVESCTISGNTGGGLYYHSNCSAATNNVRNCILYYNGGVGDLYDGTVAKLLSKSVMYSCTAPAPGSGFEIEGVVTSEPSFKDRTLGNYRLSGSSPCIDRGTNQLWMATAADLDGLDRILRQCVDLGCYECPPPSGTLVVVQ